MDTGSFVTQNYSRSQSFIFSIALKIRELCYGYEVVNTPQECRSFLKSIFDGTCTNTDYKDIYVEYVRGQVADIAEWRREQRGKTKKKRPSEEDAKDTKKMATEAELQD
ncbi:hypothetical protein TNCV_2827791 [Trichonephila clavipes]|nr:hypothetical protein TNCV_2827791 [Trichonephila clavipes]